MLQKIRQLHRSVITLLGVLLIALAVGGVNIVSAQSQSTQSQAAANTARHRAEQPVWEEVNRQIKLNPDNPAPPEVVSQLVSLNVAYRDFNGRRHQGIIEVNRALEADVLTFFRYAYYLNFPIREVAVSSDPRFQWDDNKLMAADITSGFNYRTIAGTTTQSQHGLGR
jgi:hypothetical protein